jgi:hypothetical protein
VRRRLFCHTEYRQLMLLERYLGIKRFTVL